jgi:hypothetical protein
MFDLRESIRKFLEIFNEVWLENKQKEFGKNPLRNSKRNLIWVYDGFFDVETVYAFDPRTKKNVAIGTTPIRKHELFDLKRYCLDYYNVSKFHNAEDEIYEWLGFNELEKSGKLRIKPMSPNVKILVNGYLNNLNDYFEASLTSAGGIIFRINEFKILLNEEIGIYLIAIETKSTELKNIVKSLNSIFIRCLDNKYAQYVESHSRPNNSKLTLDFDLNRTELVALIYLLFKSDFLKDTKENRDFCIEHFTFDMNQMQNLFTTNSNFNNLLGKIKKEKKGKNYHNLDDVMTKLLDTIFYIKDPPKE